jgi:hypothetical protein
MIKLFFIVYIISFSTALFAQLSPFEKNGKWGYIDESGTEITEAKYNFAEEFREGLAKVEMNNKWGFIDKTGKEVIPCNFDMAGQFSEGYASVKVNNKWGYIDKSGKIKIPCTYDDTKDFSEGLAVVWTSADEQWSVIDSLGNETKIINGAQYSINSFSERRAAVILEGTGIIYYLRKKDNLIQKYNPDMRVFLEDAIEIGMHNANFPIDIAKHILKKGSTFFVAKCDICSSTKSGIEGYLNTVQSGITTVPDSILTALKSDEKEEQQKAFANIVNSYVDSHFENLIIAGVSDQSILKLRSELEVGMKQGMSFKEESFGKFCPSCDGANKKKHVLKVKNN